MMKNLKQIINNIIISNLKENVDDLDRYSIDEYFQLYRDGIRIYASDSKKDLLKYLQKNKPELINKFNLEPVESEQKHVNKYYKPKLLSRKKYSQQEMVAMGANYHLHHGMLMMIPINRIEGLDPEPATWQDDEGEREFEKGQKIVKPIEVIYDSDSDIFSLQDGNHRIKQAKLNGDTFIKAFVQADNKQYLKWLNQ